MPFGAVLCGGRSTRMGTDKALVEVDGVAMAARVAAALRDGGCDTVVAVGGDVVGLAAVGLDVITDDHPGDGPLGGILTALRHAPAGAGAIVVASCDLPWLTGAVVGGLLAALGQHDVAVATTDRRQPTCAAWRSEAMERVAALFAAGERAVHRALDGLDVVDVAAATASLRNVNSPADLLGRRPGR